MSLSAWFGRHLACGCVRGIRLCAEAEALWNAVADEHNVIAQAWQRDDLSAASAAHHRYEAALGRFTAHIEAESADVGVQQGML